MEIKVNDIIFENQKTRDKFDETIKDVTVIVTIEYDTDYNDYFVQTIKDDEELELVTHYPPLYIYEYDVFNRK